VPDQLYSHVRVGYPQALAVAALLSGARFSLHSQPEPYVAAPEQPTDADLVAVHTVTLTNTSPVIGHSVAGIELPAGSNAAVPAVIRDQTPELIEDPAREPRRPGARPLGQFPLGGRVGSSSEGDRRRRADGWNSEVVARARAATRYRSCSPMRRLRPDRLVVYDLAADNSGSGHRTWRSPAPRSPRSDRWGR